MNAQEKIYGQLYREILENKYPAGCPLPSLREMAAYFKTSVGPIRQALDRLRFAGYINSQHGKGNFVVKRTVAVKDILLLTKLEGHIFTDIVREFSRIFSGRPGYNLIIEEAPTVNDFQAVARLKEKLDNIFQTKNLEAIFYNGYVTFKTDFLAEYAERTQLYCYYEPARWNEPACRGVITDNHYGGEIGIEHLYQAGCRNLLVITHCTEKYDATSAVKKFINGCRRKSELLGVPLMTLEHQAEAPDYAEKFGSVLAEHPEFDGIYALGDFRFNALYPVLRRQGRRIGGDIALLGYYNTPLVTAFDPALSSVNIFPDLMVAKVCDMYFQQNHRPGTLQIVLPQVVKRESSHLNNRIGG